MRKGSATGSGGASRLSRYVRAPFRALVRARDLYVKGMTGCAGRVHHGSGGGGYHPGTVPRSFSYAGSGRLGGGEEDYRELIRAASQRRMESLGLSPAKGEAGSTGPVQRSQSVAVGRIDEDQPFDGGDVAVGVDLLFPRSRSYAVGAKRNVRVFA